MKIVSLTAENIKRLKAVTIRPDGTMIVVGGRNEQGKSSVLDSIAYALGGQRLCPSEPIRHGETSAKVTVDLGEILIERSFTPKGSYLKVRNKEGFEATSPQALLDKLIGNLSFDPLAFARMPAKEQADVLRTVAGVELGDLETARAVLYTERADANREATSLAARVKALPPYTEETPVNIAALLAELDEAEKTARASAEAAGIAGEWQQKADAAREEKRRMSVNDETVARDYGESVDHLEEEKAAIENRLQQRRGRLDDIRRENKEHDATMAATVKDTEAKANAAQCAAADSAAAIIPTGPIKERLAAAEGINARVREAEAGRALVQEAVKATKATTALSEKIKGLDAERAARIAAADLPIPGLSFDASGVRLNGIPFDQVSDAQRLQASVAMGLAMNPGVKVILIHDGSLLDDDHLAMVAGMAEKAGAQVWVERVGDGPEVSVLIEDGGAVKVCSECGTALIHGPHSEDVSGLCPPCLLAERAGN